MSIHHATLKKAEKANIELTDGDDGYGYVAKDGKHKLTHPRAPQALDGALLNRMLRKEWPGFRVDFNFVSMSWIITYDGEVILEDGDANKCPTLADVLEAAEHADIDPEGDSATEEAAAEEGEEDERRQVVPNTYKVKWSEEGHRDHCGDWLAEFLKGKFEVVNDGKIVFDPDAFAQFLIENSVDMSGKWASLPDSGSRGWQGRYRMNGRQKLEKIVADRGALIYAGKEYNVPKDELARLRERHPQAAE